MKHNHITGLKAYVTIEVFRLNGKRRVKRKSRSDSFVEAFLSLILAQMDSDTAVIGVTDMGGTDRDITANAISLNMEPETATRGILVGTGTTAVDITDYDLATRIASGVDSGELVYGLQVFSAMTIVDPNASFTVYRDFLNSSGGSITVNEVGIGGKGYGDTLATIFLLIRDLISGGQAVADGENLRVTYTIQTST